ncbi:HYPOTHETICAL PROTEIN MCJ_000800 [Mesomycoplasma conjunctivae]|uniref:Peptidase S7 domain-containing protein n=1 Tax=Mesomycoplasma conjunctivae (strain ATCC 25834 / NCTC 10147 / HRC/581) TaxID=572263 RepID=C5J5N2_MESCH|nr:HYPOTHETICAL PROTEIN MCJ_000800 [Mesomycoplasma conjunctivae]
MGFVTILQSDFTPKQIPLFLYTKDKKINSINDKLYVENIDFNDGSSGSPLFYKNKIVGVYKGKEVVQGKLTSFFNLFTNQIIDNINK